jgi:hypothetical protein
LTSKRFVVATRGSLIREAWSSGDDYSPVRP